MKYPAYWLATVTLILAASLAGCSGSATRRPTAKAPLVATTSTTAPNVKAPPVLTPPVTGGVDVCRLIPGPAVAEAAGVKVRGSGLTLGPGVTVCDYTTSSSNAYGYLRIYLYYKNAAIKYAKDLADAGRSATPVPDLGQRAFATETSGLEVLASSRLVQIWGGPGQGSGHYGSDIAIAQLTLRRLG